MNHALTAPSMELILNRIFGSNTFYLIRFMNLKNVIDICILVLLSTQGVFCADSDTLSPVSRHNPIQGEHIYKESIYVSLDKNFYVSGEYLRFKIYCLESGNKYPSMLSKIAYLELLDTGNNSIIQAKIQLIDGIGYGDLFIPSNFNSGNYIFRAYTKWMRNCGPEEFFHSIITIINPFRKAGLLPEPKSDKINLKFSPEGGDLVYGLRSKIAFQATDDSGNGIELTGYIVDDSDSSLLEFTPDKSGLGSFFLKTEIGKSYHAKILLPDSSENIFKLPVIKSSGHVMHIEKLNNQDLSIKVESSNTSTKESLLLEGIIDNDILFQYIMDIEEGHGSIQVSYDDFAPGILQIYLKNFKDQILNQRRIIIYPAEGIHLNIQPNKKTYQKREKMVVKISSRDHSEIPVDMDLSISVALYDATFDRYRNDIGSYLLLHELIKINPDFSTVLEDCITEHCKKKLDNLLLVSSDIDFKQNDLQQDPGSAEFIPEFRSHIITGKLTNNQTKLPESGIKAYLSTPSKNANFIAAQSRQNGRLIFELPNMKDLNKIIVQTDNTKDTNFNIDIDDPFSKEYASINIPKFDLDEGLEIFLEKTSKNMQIRNAYLKYSPIMEIMIDSDSSVFYEPDEVYYLDDYTRFPVMEEVMREYVKGVYVRRNQEGFHFKILDLDRTETYQENPLILIDGIPIFDVDDIMETDPLFMKKIETVRKRFIKDGYEYSGIVSFFTYKGDLSGYNVQEKAEVIKYEGIQARRKYVSPAYDNTVDKKTRIPDYRNVLYWNPQFHTNEKGEAILEFYTSDDSGDYEIRVEGIDKDGRTAFGKLLIQVQDNPK